MAKKSKLDKIKDIMDDYSLRSQKYLEEETGLKIPLETIDISVVIAYYLKNSTPKEKKDLQFLSEELYLMANQTLLFKEDPFFADVLKHIERDAFNLKFDAPAAVYMPKNDNEIHLVINPFRLAKLCKSYEECAAVLEHECLHVLNRHLELYDEAKKRGLSNFDANMSADVALNQLIKLPLPEGVVLLEEFADAYQLDVNKLEPLRDMIYYLDKIVKSGNSISDDNSQSQESGEGKSKNKDNQTSEDPNSEYNKNKDQNEKNSSNGNGKSNSKDMRPSDKIGNASGSTGHEMWEGSDSQKNKDLIQSAIDKLINDTVHNKTRGYDPGNLSGMFVDVKPPQPINWRKLVRESMQGMQDGLREAPWKPSRRHPFNLNYSGKINSYRMNVYAAIDTSGSLSDEELSSIIKSIFEFARTFEANFTVLECDSQIQEIHHIRRMADLAKLKDEIKGRGGTSYQPVFEYLINKNFNGDQDLLIYFTDGYGESHLPDNVMKKFDPIKANAFKNVLWVITRPQDSWNERNNTPAEEIKIGQHTSLLLNYD